MFVACAFLCDLFVEWGSCATFAPTSLSAPTTTMATCPMTARSAATREGPPVCHARRQTSRRRRQAHTSSASYWTFLQVQPGVQHVVHHQCTPCFEVHRQGTTPLQKGKLCFGRVRKLHHKLIRRNIVHLAPSSPQTDSFLSLTAWRHANPVSTLCHPQHNATQRVQAESRNKGAFMSQCQHGACEAATCCCA
jgi:hypothetical protein